MELQNHFENFQSKVLANVNDSNIATFQQLSLDPSWRPFCVGHPDVVWRMRIDAYWDMRIKTMNDQNQCLTFGKTLPAALTKASHSKKRAVVNTFFLLKLQGFAMLNLWMTNEVDPLVAWLQAKTLEKRGPWEGALDRELKAMIAHALRS